MLRRRIVFALGRITAAVALLLATAAGLIRQPVLTSLPYTARPSMKMDGHADPIALRLYVAALTAHRSADYVPAALRSTGPEVIQQGVVPPGSTWRNVISRF